MLEKNLFYIQTRKVELKDNFLDSIINDLYKKIAKFETEGSGWVHRDVNHLKIDFYRKTRRVKRYGSYTKWPEKAPGLHHVVNVNCVKDCVRLCMTAHFCKNKIKKMNSEKKCRYLYNRKSFYFKFPPGLKSPISMDDFEKIENHTKTEIWLYQIFKEKKSYNIRLLRKGNQPNVHESRKIYLCEIENSNHVVLIKNIQSFIRCIRVGNYSKKSLDVKHFCKICFTLVDHKKYDRHYIQCVSFKGTPRIILPNDGKKYKFNAVHALEMAPFVCFYDTESKLVRNSDIANAIHKHQIVSYKYIILDTKNKVRAKKIETDTDNLGENMIKNIMNDFQKLRKELEENWISHPVLTKEDEINFQNSTKCMVCDINFNTKKNEKDIVKVRHHRWSDNVEYDTDGNVQKGNYIGALCNSCNFMISEKQKTLPCFAHNGSNYDIRYVIDGVTNQSTKIISKSGEKFISVMITEKMGKNTRSFL